MYSLGSMPDVTENYLTENNIFDRCTGYLVTILKDEGVGLYKFKHNTYIQPYGQIFSYVGGKRLPFDGTAAGTLKTYFLEDDPVLCFIMEDEAEEK